ncbi:GNAT family N-acetyltransferase [Nocardia tengchongensis]|uniref:GNAT family N-acetyltransferase n=1 Tax=Nocardia tengchongensis TaxID=2055889 RepID=UPI0033F56A1C
MTSSTGTARLITEADVPTAVDTLARAFADYPYTRYVIDADNHLERIRRYQELCLTRIAMVYGKVWIVDGGRAVAAWSTPDRDPTAAFAEMEAELGELIGDRSEAAAASEAAIEPYRPHEPVWMLNTVAVAPEHQGRGLGTAVLRPGIEEAARAGYPAFLETSSEANVRFYQHLGFEVTADVTLADNGLRTWCMRREPSQESQWRR